jgi:Heterokaryon incompatibility protein (HET)
MARLHYTPLQGQKDIRILKLAPRRAGSFPAGELVHADLDNKPDYSALSYVWGTGLDDTAFNCNGGQIDITKNLAEALRHLQYETEPRYVWIDALCIDQENLAEKNHQVNLMKEIYAFANEVIVWLGPDDQGIASEVFLDIAATLSSFKIAISRGLDPGTSRFPPKSDKLVVLFKSEWFTRTWTIQEVGLTNRPIALWGQSMINFNQIGLAAMLHLKYFRTSLESRGHLQDIERAAKAYMIYAPQNILRRLHYILDEVRPYKAADPRDKVYAFMSHPSAQVDASDFPYDKQGTTPRKELIEQCIEWRNLGLILAPTPQNKYFAQLASIADEPLRPFSPDSFSAIKWLNSRPENDREPTRYWPGPSFINPDYSHSLVQVYRDFAIKMIERYDSLEILSFVQHNAPLPPTGPDFPSWIPRWDIHTGVSILGRTTSDHIAATNRAPVITPSSDPAALIVKGIFLDQVELNTITLSKGDFNNPQNTSPLFEMSTHCQVAKYPIPPYPQIPVWPQSGSDRIVAYRKTWTAGFAAASQDVPSYGFNPELDFAAYQLDHLRRPGQKLDIDTILRIEALRQEGAEFGNGSRFADVAGSVCDGRRFFTTGGGFFGIGPGIVEIGDYVCVLLGSDVPYILRYKPNSGYASGGYRLIGECYVHGVMRGEVVRASGEAGANLIDITIC